LVLSGQSVLLGRKNIPIRITDIQPGDVVTASGVPSPDKALVYRAIRIRDLDLRLEPEQVGVVLSKDMRARRLQIRIVKATGDSSDFEIVQIVGDTRFHGADAVQRLSGVRPNDVVDVSGLVDDRIETMVRATKITVYHVNVHRPPPSP
jgi:hypothetical protein